MLQNEYLKLCRSIRQERNEEEDRNIALTLAARQVCFLCRTCVTECQDIFRSEMMDPEKAVRYI